MVGTICKIVPDKGFLFIKLTEDPGAKDVFAHVRSFRQYPAAFDNSLLNKRVSFAIVEDRGRQRANDVVLLD